MRISAQNSPPPKSAPKATGSQTLIGVTNDNRVPELVGGTTVTPKSSENKVSARPQTPLGVTIDKDVPELVGVTTVTPKSVDNNAPDLVGVTTVTPKSAENLRDNSTQKDVMPMNGIVTPNSSVPTSSTLTADEAPNANDDKLPDLVLNRSIDKTQNATQTDVATTEDEEDAAEALLRLGEDMNLEPIDDNSTLMPIGGSGENIATDAVPVPIKLSENDVQEAVKNLQNDNVEVTDNNNNDVKGTNKQSPTRKKDSAVESTTPPTSPPTSLPKGKLEVKEYGIKKKTENEKLKFKCVKCPSRFKSRKECDKHYIEKHQPVMCGKCNKVFNTPSSLSLHMYDHEELRFMCKRCGKGFHFKGQLVQHKVDHRSTRMHKCMYANCDRWFKRKGDLVLHLETHKNKEWKCNECNHTTTCEKYLKDHVKSQHQTDKADYKYKCAVCNKRFLYHMQLSRHKDDHLK